MDRSVALHDLLDANVVEYTGFFANEAFLDQHFREKDPFKAETTMSSEPASALRLVH